MATTLLTIKEVCSILQFGRSKVYALIRSGVIPRPVKVGGSARWPDYEIDAVIAGLIAQRDKTGA